jgi:hypothetical protein
MKRLPLASVESEARELTAEIGGDLRAVYGSDDSVDVWLLVVRIGGANGTAADGKGSGISRPPVPTPRSKLEKTATLLEEETSLPVKSPSRSEAREMQVEMSPCG